MIKRILSALGALVLLAVAIVLGQLAFQKVLDFRQLERIPLTSVLASTEGEVQLRGTVDAVAEPLLAPYSKTPTVYYRYTIEKEETDSDGDKSWKTIHEERRATDFYIQDATGQAKVIGQQALRLAEWSVPQNLRLVDGGRRYTEWRIDLGNQVGVFGWLDNIDEDVTISFGHAGDYLPIITTQAETATRNKRGWASILLLAAAVTSLTFMVFFIAYTLTIHRVLVFLTLLTFACTLFLVQYGFKSLEIDTHSGYNRVKTQTERSTALIQTIFAQHNIVWKIGDTQRSKAPTGTKKWTFSSRDHG